MKTWMVSRYVGMFLVLGFMISTPSKAEFGQAGATYMGAGQSGYSNSGMLGYPPSVGAFLPPPPPMFDPNAMMQGSGMYGGGMGMGMDHGMYPFPPQSYAPFSPYGSQGYGAFGGGYGYGGQGYGGYGGGYYPYSPHPYYASYHHNRHHMNQNFSGMRPMY